MIYGGYGRAGTSFFSLFSYDEYYLDSSSRLYRLNDGKFNRRLVVTEKPI
jgi:hypothetical protein